MHYCLLLSPYNSNASVDNVIKVRTFSVSVTGVRCMEAVVVKRQVCWRDILSLLGLFFMILQREKIYGQTFNHLRSQASRI